MVVSHGYGVTASRITEQARMITLRSMVTYT